MIAHIEIHLHDGPTGDGKYHTTVESTDGTSTSRGNLSSWSNALAAAIMMIGVHLQADEPNPTPGRIPLGGRRVSK